MTRERIVERALAQCGKPYTLKGWGPQAFDCIGLVCFVGQQEGVLPHELKDEPDPELRCYSNSPNPPVLLKALKKYFERIPKEEALIGDFLLFRDPKAQHLGIITKVRGDSFWVVHANLPKGKVLQQRVRNNNYAVWAWRYPGLTNG